MIEKLRVVPAETLQQAGGLAASEIAEAPRCIIAHKWTNEIRLFERPDFPLAEFQAAIRHEVEFIHERGKNKTGGVTITPESLAATTSRAFFQDTQLLPLLVLSPFDGNPQKAMDFVYPDIAEQRRNQQQVAIFEQIPPEERRIHLIQEANEAFSLLFKNNQARIIAYLYKHLGSIDLAEELTGNVFLKAIEAWPRYQDRGIPLTAWLYRIAHNEMVDSLRRSKYDGAPLEEVDYRIGYVEEAGIVRAIDGDRQAKLLREAIGKLPSGQRSAISLRLEGLTMNEIAERTGKNEGSVKALISNAKKGLRKLLRKEDFF